jgi:hypothetical protein
VHVDPAAADASLRHRSRSALAARRRPPIQVSPDPPVTD